MNNCIADRVTLTIWHYITYITKLSKLGMLCLYRIFGITLKLLHISFSYPNIGLTRTPINRVIFFSSGLVDGMSVIIRFMSRFGNVGLNTAAWRWFNLRSITQSCPHLNRVERRRCIEQIMNFSIRALLFRIFL